MPSNTSGVEPGNAPLDSDSLTVLGSNATTTERGEQQPDSISRTLTPQENVFGQDSEACEYHDNSGTNVDIHPALDKSLLLTGTAGDTHTSDQLFSGEFDQFEGFGHFEDFDLNEGTASSNAVPDIQQGSNDALHILYPPDVEGSSTSQILDFSIPSLLGSHDPATFDCFQPFPDNLENTENHGKWMMFSNEDPWSPSTIPSSQLHRANFANDSTELQLLNAAELVPYPTTQPSMAESSEQTGKSFMKMTYTTQISSVKQIGSSDTAEIQQKDVAADQKPGRKRGRAKFDSEQREKVKRVRKIGACMRCRIYKVECDIDDVENPKQGCSRCKEVHSAGKARLFKEPCVRQDLMDVATFRMGNSKFGQHRAQHRQLNFRNISDKKIIQLCFPFKKPGQTYVPVLSVVCQEFIPGEGDVLTRVWRDGDKSVQWEFPPVAIPDTDACGKAITLFLKESFDSMRGDMIAPDVDPIVSATFSEALRYSDKHPESTLVHNALRVWVGTRLSAGVSFVLCGEETLGLEKLNDSSIHYDQTIPPPPVLDHQIDVIMIHHLEKVQAQILKDLKKKVFQGNQKEWFEIFLVVFILLDNLEFVFRRQLIYKRRHLESNLESTVSAVTKRMMEEWEYSAKNLISHFRCVIRGPVPFTLDWQNTKKANKRRAGLDEESCTFIEKMCKDIQARRDELNAIQAKESIGAYDYPLIWISKILLDDTD